MDEGVEDPRIAQKPSVDQFTLPGTTKMYVVSVSHVEERTVLPELQSQTHM